MTCVDPADVQTFERCTAVGGVALFPADTVYGLATEPDSREAVERMYRLKGRRPDRPAAVMFFSLELALSSLPDLPGSTRAAVERLLPGALTLLVPNPARHFPLACGPEPEGWASGCRACSARWRRWLPCAGPSCSRAPTSPASARRAAVDEVDERVRAGVDMVLDGGELPGLPSTVVDLTGYHDDGRFAVLREGAVPVEAVEAALVR